MFSKYKKTSDKPAKPQVEVVDNVTSIEEAKPEQAAPVAARRKASTNAAEPAPVDKELKRKQRMSDIKLELHRALLDNLNLAALEHASEQDLRQEINAISSEILAEKSIVLNREDRMTLNSELYDEVTGLGPLETLLKDDTVNDILVNGPQQIFVERAGKLELNGHHVQGRTPPAAHHRQDRVGRGSSCRRIQPLRGRPFARRIAFQRNGAPDCGRRLARLYS